MAQEYYIPSFAELVWLAFFLWLFLTFLTPQMRYRALQAARINAIRKLEQRMGAKVITMIHREERVTMFGIPLYKFISIEDSEAVIRAIRSTPPDTPVALVLHTPGGLVLAASQIARALKRHPAKKIVIVPHYAMSGGTLIALAADEIWMDKNAVLGPLDPQIVLGDKTLPAPSILRAVEAKGADKVGDEMLVLADVARKAVDQMKRLVYELVADRVGPEKAREIAERLVMGYYTHDYPITVDELRAMGLKVRDELPEEVYELMELYPQEGIRRPAVEYVPGLPRHRAEKPFATPRTRAS